jgi:uncharacterized protein with gpF-like domain
MNKRQKEVHQAFLDNEKEVLEMLEDNYKDAIAEIDEKIALLLGRQDADMQNVIYQVEYQKALKGHVEGILTQLQSNEFQTVSQYLQKAYEDGFIGAMYDMQGQGVPLVIPINQEAVVAAIQHETKLSEDLYTALGKDTKRLSKQIAAEISRGISNNATYEEITRNIASFSNIPMNNAARIARTEAHRIQCKATADAQFRAKEKGADVVKQWDSFLDGKTRSSHRHLDGQIRELEEPFEVNGKEAMQPGGFGDPAEDINCRCALLQRARWAVGNDFTKYDRETGDIVEIKAKDYDDFKNKYKKQSELVRSSAQKKKGKVIELNKYEFEGNTYEVDGKHVILDNTKHEKDIAQLLAKELGAEVQMVPRVVYPQGISTPDYIIDGRKYDLKEPTGSGKNVLYNMINKKKKQADNFVFDVSKCPLEFDQIEEQIKGIYSSSHTTFVNDIIVVKDEAVKKKYKRE